MAVALILALAPVAAPRPGYGQSTAEDPTTAMARARFKEGVDFYDRGEFEQARGSFVQAYALKKHPAVLLNLAWSCLKSGHAIDADRYFKQFLAEGRDITEKQRADANDGLTQARAKLGRIEVVAGAGTDVTVDGDRVGSAPLAEPVVVEAGAHTVKFKASDGTVETQSITVMGGEKSVARFKGAGPAAPAITSPPPPPPPAEPSPPATPSPAPPSKPAAEETTDRSMGTSVPSASGEAGGKSVLAPPKNVAPVFLLGGTAVLAYAGTGLLLYFKGQAQGKADQVPSLLGKHMCPAAPADSATVQQLCQALSTDNGQVNDDALWANVLLAVGITTTAATVVYWLVADKADERHTAKAPILAPMVGPGVGGVSLSGQF